jgi:hypothetical protein
MKKTIFALIFIFYPVVHLFAAAPAENPAADQSLRKTIEILSSYGSRSTGTPGYEKAADFIEQAMRSFGLEPQTYLYDLPIRRFLGAELRFAKQTIHLTPFINTSITP